MTTFSLLQISLDQTIDRQSLEDASVVVPSVARADCAGIQRDLFGIVVSGLPFEEAAAFQTELKRRGFPTDVVADEKLPLLHAPFTIQRIDIRDDALLFTDMMGRVQPRIMAELVFVAGGSLKRNRMKSDLVLESGDRPHENSSAHQARLERRHFVEEFPEFRLDFFFSTAPNRLRAAITPESMIFFRERPVRLRDTALLLGAMMDLRELLPPERVGEGLKKSDTRTVYPSLRSYEEEIRWHFYRLTPGA